MSPRLLSLLLAAVVVLGVGGYFVYRFGPAVRDEFVETVERTEVRPPPPDPADELTDDRLEDKNPKFDPDLADRRPLGEWRLNASAAVLRLDVALTRPDQEPGLLTLYPSYAAAVAAVRGRHGDEVLPSVNLLDGKAKQFDDGLYAALDLAYYEGLDNALRAHVDLVRRMHEKAGKDSPAAPFLAAALELAGVPAEAADAARKDEYLRQFRANAVASKPIGFYTWNERLGNCFRFLRFLQREFGPGELAVPAALAKVLADDRALADDYRKALRFYARLTNPYLCLSAADLVGVAAPESDLGRLVAEKKVSHRAVAVFPPSTARETVLFERLFPNGLPENANLMRELVRRIRSGEVDLTPNQASGWYEHQVYALETLLLPEKGEERDKLLLTKSYKKRMLEAFQALITKRRETHVRQLGVAEMAAAAARPPEDVRPRLRVEPCPSYYVRTARAYAFLANFLEAAVGKEALQKLHGLKQDGRRGPDLYTELNRQRDLFYGLYLVSCEDVGLRPTFLAGEEADAERCYRAAAEWLPTAFDDPDLAADTRVSVPIFADPVRGVTRVWATLGVRLAKLETRYERPPSLRPAAGGDWQEARPHQLASARYLIPVDEFAEVQLGGLTALTREELRAVCDREKTRDAILAALGVR